MKTLYTAHAKATGGREGTAESSDKQLNVKLASPASGKAGTNPEQLFAIGYAACFGSAIQHVAKLKKAPVSQVEVQAEVDLNQDDNGYFISVTLSAELQGVDQQTAERLVQEAHKTCPYSKATRNNIQVTLKANGQNLKAAA